MCRESRATTKRLAPYLAPDGLSLARGVSWGEMLVGVMLGVPRRSSKGGPQEHLIGRGEAERHRVTGRSQIAFCLVRRHELSDLAVWTLFRGYSGKPARIWRVKQRKHKPLIYNSA
jgi:hypothetical protein